MDCQSKYRSLRILKILQIQKEHKLHRQRLRQIIHSSRSTSPKLDRSRGNSHVKTQLIKTMKEIALKSRRKQSKQRINTENGVILDRLHSIYYRETSDDMRKTQQNNKPKSLLAKAEAKQKVAMENIRIHEKLVTARSQLSNEKLKEDYQEHKKFKEMMLGNSSQNKSHLKKLLQKNFKITPSVMLPKLRVSSKKRNKTWVN